VKTNVTVVRATIEARSGQVKREGFDPVGSSRPLAHLKARDLGVMRVSYCIEQALIQSRSVENNFAVVRRANGVQGNDELSRILNINRDLIAIFQPHIAHSAARIAALFQIYLRADLYLSFLLHNTILFRALSQDLGKEVIALPATDSVQ
jgi:hypothetical protein